MPKAIDQEAEASLDWDGSRIVRVMETKKVQRSFAGLRLWLCTDEYGHMQVFPVLRAYRGSVLIYDKIEYSKALNGYTHGP